MNKNRIFFANFFIYVVATILLFIPLFIFKNSYFLILGKLFTFRLDIISIVITISILILIVILDIIVAPKLKSTRGNIDKFNRYLSIDSIPTIFILIFSFFVALCEEIIFRGYLIALLFLILPTIISVNFTGTLIILLLSILFALLHLYQGVFNVIMIFLISIALFVILVISKTIWYPIIFHFILDFIQLAFILPYQKRIIDGKKEQI